MYDFSIRVRNFLNTLYKYIQWNSDKSVSLISNYQICRINWSAPSKKNLLIYQISGYIGWISQSAKIRYIAVLLYLDWTTELRCVFSRIFSNANFIHPIGYLIETLQIRSCPSLSVSALLMNYFHHHRFFHSWEWSDCHTFVSDWNFVLFVVEQVLNSVFLRHELRRLESNTYPSFSVHE